MGTQEQAAENLRMQVGRLSRAGLITVGIGIALAVVLELADAASPVLAGVVVAIGGLMWMTARYVTVRHLTGDRRPRPRG